MEEKKPDSVPYIVYESALARQEEQHKREREKDKETIHRLVWALIVVSIVAIFIHVSWVFYELQFDTISYVQDGEGINNINTGEQGDVLNGAKTQGEEETEREIEGSKSPER